MASCFVVGGDDDDDYDIKFMNSTACNHFPKLTTQGE
jgi:hypothetical protein